MATSRLVLLPNAAEPLGSAYPGLTKRNDRPVLAFDADADEACAWTFVAWQGISGALTAKILMSGDAAGTNSTYWEASLEAIADEAIDLDGDSFATANTGNHAMPTTNGDHKTLPITLTNDDSIAAGHLCRLKLSRDANHGSDNFAADAFVHAVEIQEA